MKKIKIGVLGGYRGTSMIKYCTIDENAEIVAVCDNNPMVLNDQRENLKHHDVAFYDNFDDFIKHDMDAVVLANFATEHAPFAIKCMKAGKHVFSEVLPVQTMKEAVELIETVEETGMTYAYGENYCFMSAPYEMRRLYRLNKIGEFEYGECEYIHNCEPIWAAITYGDKNHWRNNMYSTFYCTHSIGPMIHSLGLRPVKVTGFESSKNERRFQNGSKGAAMGMEIITLENGGIIKSVHGGLYKGSVWYSMYGNKGRMESAREGTSSDDVSRIYVDCDDFPGQYKPESIDSYKPTRDKDNVGGDFGHSGSDFYIMYNFVQKLLGNKDADIIDVYEAMDMFLPGMFAYRSILNGNVPTDIPNLRDKKERDKWRYDTACTDPKIAGDMLLPTCGGGTPDIDDKIYDAVKKKCEYEMNHPEGTHFAVISFSDEAKDEDK